MFCIQMFPNRDISLSAAVPWEYRVYMRRWYATAIMFFAHLLILEDPDHYQNLISSSLYHLRPLHKISAQSVHNILSDIVHKQTNKQTDRHTNQFYQKYNLLLQRRQLWKISCEDLKTRGSKSRKKSLCNQHFRNVRPINALHKAEYFFWETI